MLTCGSMVPRLRIASSASSANRHPPLWLFVGMPALVDALLAGSAIPGGVAGSPNRSAIKGLRPCTSSARRATAGVALHVLSLRDSAAVGNRRRDPVDYRFDGYQRLVFPPERGQQGELRRTPEPARSVIWVMIWRLPAAARSSRHEASVSLVPRFSTTCDGMSGRRRPISWTMRANGKAPFSRQGLANVTNRGHGFHLDATPIDRVRQGVAAHADPVAVMPAGELGGEGATIDVRGQPGPWYGRSCVGRRLREFALPSLCNHPHRDRVAAVREHGSGR